MADRIPLIVNPDASQIQELPNADDLVLSGQLKMTGTTAGASDINLSGGNDALSVITVTGTSSNSSQLHIACRNNNNTADVSVAQFKVGASNKIEVTTGGEITAAQPSCLLTNVTNVANFDSNNNDDAIGFDTITTNVGCTVGNATNAAARSRITLPSTGTYLVSANISGTCSNNTGGQDSVQIYLRRNGTTNSNVYPTMDTYPRSVFGQATGQEFFLSFTLPLPLNAGDFLEISIRELNSGVGEATLKKGYFSVTKLH